MSKYNADYPSKSSRLRHIKYHNYLLVECVFSTFDNKRPMIDHLMNKEPVHNFTFMYIPISNRNVNVEI